MIHRFRTPALFFLATCLLVLLPLLLMPAPASAATATASSASECKTTNPSGEVCTNFACLQQKAGDGKPGMITHIVEEVKSIVGDASKNLYKAFTSNAIYKNSVRAAMILMVIFYAISFMIGMTQPNYSQILKLLVRMGILFTLISPTGWDFFSSVVVKFFNDGTDEMIRIVVSIGTKTDLGAGDSPFIQLDGLAKWMLSPDMIIAMTSMTFNAGPYGLALGGLLGFAFGGVIKLLIEALKIYGLAFIMRSLLLGVAPVFLVFLLFERTKNLFSGWLNALVSMSLKPILYFTFISFFLVMITTAAADMLGAEFSATSSKKPIEFCWAESPGQQGTQNKVAFWRMKLPGDTAATADSLTWNGLLSCSLGTNPDACKKSFPINPIDLLSFLILIYIAQRFGDVIDRLSSEISNAFINLDTQSRVDFGQKDAAAATKTSGGGVNASAGDATVKRK